MQVNYCTSLKPTGCMICFNKLPVIIHFLPVVSNRNSLLRYHSIFNTIHNNYDLCLTIVTLCRGVVIIRIVISTWPFLFISHISHCIQLINVPNHTTLYMSEPLIAVLWVNKYRNQIVKVDAYCILSC